MSKSLSSILRGAGPSIEDDMAQLVRERERNLSPPPIPRTNALTEEVNKLIPRSMIESAEQLVERAKQAAAKYRDEAQAQYEEVERWGETLILETKRAATTIAENHAAMIRSAQHFRAAMENNQPPLPKQIHGPNPNTIVEED